VTNIVFSFALLVPKKINEETT